MGRHPGERGTAGLAGPPVGQQGAKKTKIVARGRRPALSLECASLPARPRQRYQGGRAEARQSRAWQGGGPWRPAPRRGGRGAAVVAADAAAAVVLRRVGAQPLQPGEVMLAASTDSLSAAVQALAAAAVTTANRRLLLVLVRRQLQP
jgi:hypothetical protein